MRKMNKPSQNKAKRFISAYPTAYIGTPRARFVYSIKYRFCLFLQPLFSDDHKLNSFKAFCLEFFIISVNLDFSLFKCREELFIFFNGEAFH